MTTRVKKYLLWGLMIVVLMAGFVWFRQKRDSGSGTTLHPISTITHGHGLAVAATDANKLYIATHHGLVVLLNDKDLYRIGRSQDDLMGFSVHPTDAQVLFTSGHPQTGGNLGVQKSEDGGVTWKKLSSGVRGPVDFHAMAVSPANPNLLYGWYRGLQRSTDGGKTWEALEGTLSEVISLAAHPTDENVVFAMTSQGLLVSRDKGAQWSGASDALQGGAVVALAVHPREPEKMLSFSEALGLAKSTDDGRTWEKLNETFGGDIVLHLAITRQTPDTVYAITRSNALYKSTDSGGSWQKIR